MPGANEVLGCPTCQEICSCQFVSKFSDDLFSSFLSILHSILRFYPDEPPYPGCPGLSPYFLLIFNQLPSFSHIYLYLFQKTPPLDAPLLVARSRRTNPHPLCTPLPPGLPLKIKAEPSTKFCLVPSTEYFGPFLPSTDTDYLTKCKLF